MAKLLKLFATATLLSPLSRPALSCRVLSGFVGSGLNLEPSLSGVNTNYLIVRRARVAFLALFFFFTSLLFVHLHFFFAHFSLSSASIFSVDRDDALYCSLSSG